MFITAELVKKLRLKSGSGIMDCKKALIDSDGDINKAILLLKSKGYIKAEKKIKNIATRGVIFTYLKNRIGYMLELNCETEFVEKHVDFLNFAKKILSIAYNSKIIDVLSLKELVESKRVFLVSKFSENIILRRFCMLSGDHVSSYIHRNRIGVLVHSNCENIILTKKIAMQIAANNPDYLDRQHIPDEFIKQEKKIQLDLAVNSGKPLLIAKKIVHGKIEKMLNNICLLEQNFIFDTEKKVKDFVLSNGIQIFKFSRFELGEEI